MQQTKHLVANRGVRIDDETYLKLQEIAKRDERSANNLIVVILKKYVAEYETANGAIKVNTDDLYK
jgi:predicted transcriptional regulator